jgi:hypothetical protein
MVYPRYLDAVPLTLARGSPFVVGPVQAVSAFERWRRLLGDHLQTNAL